MIKQDSVFAPNLTEGQIEIFREKGEELEYEFDSVLVEQDTKRYDFFIVLEGNVRILDPTNDCALIADHKQHEFVGDTDILSGRSSIFRAVAGHNTKLLRVPNEQLKHIISKHSDISDVLLKAFFVRRSELLNQESGGLKLIGSRFSQNTYELRNFLSKNHVRHLWIDVEKDEQAKVILKQLEIEPAETPILITGSGEVLRNPSVKSIADFFGLSEGVGKDSYDLLVVGAGPGGLAASVYAASEGLSVITIDAVGPGGQAGKSSKIENYLGFPSGLSGSDLAKRAYIQAQKFGCLISIPHKAKKLHHKETHFKLETEDGTEISANTVIVATGADYRSLPIENFEKFEGNGIFYDAGTMQSQTCKGEEVGIVGGGNSAGQAALFLADYAKKVHVVLRSNDLGKSMSDYLVQRILASDKIEVHYQSNVVGLGGNEYLESFQIQKADTKLEIKTNHVFIFIGAKPSTDWVAHLVETDEKGFVLTGEDVTHSYKNDHTPMQLETSVPGIFAVGDVRSGSSKRVATAVGEGSMAVGFVHKFLGAL